MKPSPGIRLRWMCALLLVFSALPATSEVPVTGAVEPGEAQRNLEKRADAYFKNNPAQRGYIQLDKPLYQPGETVWIRTTMVRSATLTGQPGVSGITYQLISPRGAVVLQKRVKATDGIAFNDFELPDGIDGGEYTLQAVADSGATEQRTFIINTYEAPRFQKTLDFLKKAYGPGDTISATIEVKRPTGEPFAERELSGAVTLDGAELPRVTFRTDAKGAALVSMPLPAKIERGDAILTVLVADGGITESVTKRVPIILRKLKLSFFPEGGDLVAGLPSRVYFAAQDMLDKPADVAGKVIDDHGQTAAIFTSLHDGMGRFELTPATGRTYHVELSRPAGVTERFQLPVGAEQGCTMKLAEDPKGEAAALKAQVHCTEARTVLASVFLRENRLATATARVEPGRTTLLELPLARPILPGVARVTLFSEGLEPLAERLVFRGWNRQLKVTVKPDKSSYTPRGQVTLDVETRDLFGKPIAASLAMAVVDDAVLSYADDKTGHLLARLLLESELPDKVEEPNYYFRKDKEDAPQALDMLLGTRGWRRFEWQQVLAPPPAPVPDYSAMNELMPGGIPMDAPAAAMAMRELDKVAVEAEAPVMQRPMAARPGVMARAQMAPPPMAQPKVPQMQAGPRPILGGVLGRFAGKKEMAPARDERRRDLRGMAAGGAVGDGELANVDGRLLAVEGWAKVRVFPVPRYERAAEGPRSDFRETIYWNPDVRTDENGKARVTFPVSDAITSFRVTTEGLSLGGLVGRDETHLTSKLPFFMDVKLPVEVSAGDLIDLPLTLKNEENVALGLGLQARFGTGLRLLAHSAPDDLKLDARAARTMSVPLEVIGRNGKVEVSFAAQAQGLKDELTRTLSVVPLGFPRKDGFSGTLEKTVTRTLDLRGASEGSLSAKLTLYPSPLASMLTGLDSILQEPNGCFEQTSSTNYPNVMVMTYLQQRQLAEPAIAERASRLLQSGYGRLTSFESPQRGYEWFGGDPGHEALTAYGLMEFADMRAVYGGVENEMIKRTTAWLMNRRDGKGGFTRNARALDSFGAASPEITNGYIVYALTEAGAKDIARELDATSTVAMQSSDPYLVALAAKSHLNTRPESAEAQALAKKLAGMQREDGSFHGTTHSITRSGGHGLDVETTSLTMMALLQAGKYTGEVRNAAQWLVGARDGSGGFGSTQATILALKALTAYDRASRQTEAGGEVTVVINGQEVQRLTFEKGRKDAIVLDGLGKYLARGENTVQLKLVSTRPLPYTFAVDYASNDPASSPNVPLKLSTAIAREDVKMGETVRITAHLENASAQGQPMTLARIGIPGGASFQTWQLKELVEKKVIDFYETRPREVVLYFRSLAPGAKKDIALDLVANVPGKYTAPASSAYLYYTAEDKAWTSPLKVRIDRG